MDRVSFATAYGPWAVVTGASDGIGLAFAERLAGLRQNLVLVARRSPRLREVATKLADHHGVETRIVGADFATVARSVVVPGALGKFLTYTLLPLPRAARVRILARVMGGMTAHRRAMAT